MQKVNQFIGLLHILSSDVKSPPVLLDYSIMLVMLSDAKIYWTAIYYERWREKLVSFIGLLYNVSDVKS